MQIEVGDVLVLKKASSMWGEKMGSIKNRSRFSVKMSGLWTSDDDSTKKCRKEHKEY